MNTHINTEHAQSTLISQENPDTHEVTASYIPANPHEVDNSKNSDVFKNHWWNVKSIYKWTAGHPLL